MEDIGDALVNGEQILDVSSIKPEYLHIMKDCGIIVDTDFDEIEYLGVLSNVSRFNSDLRSITAVITTNCNFSCNYCFQSNAGNQTRNVMSSEVMDRIADLVRETKAMRMNLCLFGGEPLLYPEKCYELCEKVVSAWASRNNRLSIPIITNGYNLTENVAVNLSSIGVSVAQVTLDGMRESHDKRRPLAGGGPTFDIIVNNIKSACKYMDIVVRVNLDKGFQYELDGLYRLFSEENIQLRPAVTRYEHCNQPERTSENIQILDSYKEGIGESKIEDIQLKIAGCSAVSMGGFTVMPNGDIVRCWNEIERDPQQIHRDSIFDSKLHNMRSIYKWLAWGPYSPNSFCYQCKMLPNCGGLCPDDMMRNGKPYCHINAKFFHRAITNHIED